MMQKFFYNNRINFLFLFISLFYLVFTIGIDNISFQSTEWLHNGSDVTLPQLSWYFFKNDIWRFPFGSNPNYGDELSSSIVFSDSIPILALFFKLFKSFIPESFQYISFWYLICFYFQLFFSYKILKKFTDSNLYSVIGSIFFIVTPIFVFRLQMHPALSGQWILLFTLYLGLIYGIEKSKVLWASLIFFSSLINFYFMVIIFCTYLLLRIFNLKLEKENIYKFIKDFSIISILLLIIMYVVGYFEVRMADTLAVGFGRDKLNLLSIFDSVNNVHDLHWSWLIPDIKLLPGEEFEGFNYFGLGQIIVVVFAIILFLKKSFRTNVQSITSSRKIKNFLFISIFFTLWALSNKISIGSYVLLEIPLNKYIFGLLSIVRPTGRLFWIVNYFLLLISLIIIFKCFNKKTSLLIILLFLAIQIGDTSATIKQRLNLFNVTTYDKPLKDQIWADLFEKYKILKTTYPKNYTGLFHKFSYSIEKYNIKKTNLVKMARINRKAVADGKYITYKNFHDKNLSQNTVYAIHDLSHLRHLKYLFKNENVGFFYRDDVWIMVSNERERMSEGDKKLFSEIKLKSLDINKKVNLIFEQEDNYYGLGWSHNLGNLGIWSEGKISTLLFRTVKNYGNLKLEIISKPFLTKKNNFTEFDIYINNLFTKKVKLTKDNQDEKIEIIIKKETLIENEIKVDFKFKNPISPYEVLQSPDSRKLGILVKSIVIQPI